MVQAQKEFLYHTRVKSSRVVHPIFRLVLHAPLRVSCGTNSKRFFVPHTRQIQSCSTPHFQTCTTYPAQSQLWHKSLPKFIIVDLAPAHHATHPCTRQQLRNERPNKDINGFKSQVFSQNQLLYETPLLLHCQYLLNPSISIRNTKWSVDTPRTTAQHQSLQSVKRQVNRA